MKKHRSGWIILILIVLVIFMFQEPKMAKKGGKMNLDATIFISSRLNSASHIGPLMGKINPTTSDWSWFKFDLSTINPNLQATGAKIYFYHERENSGTAGGSHVGETYGAYGTTTNTWTYNTCYNHNPVTGNCPKNLVEIGFKSPSGDNEGAYWESIDVSSWVLSRIQAGDTLISIMINRTANMDKGSSMPDECVHSENLYPYLEITYAPIAGHNKMAEWHFNQDALDSVSAGADHSVSLISGGYTGGMLNLGLNFTPGQGYGKVNDPDYSLSVKGRTQQSISLAVMPSKLTNGKKSYLYFEPISSSAAYPRWALILDGYNFKLVGSETDSTTLTTFAAATVGVSPGYWYQITAIYDAAGTSKLFINNVLRASVATSKPAFPSTNYNSAGIFIGKTGAADFTTQFEGTIDELTIYDYALTDLEVADIYREMVICPDMTSCNSDGYCINNRCSITDLTYFPKLNAATLGLGAPLKAQSSCSSAGQCGIWTYDGLTNSNPSLLYCDMLEGLEECIRMDMSMGNPITDYQAISFETIFFKTYLQLGIMEFFSHDIATASLSKVSSIPKLGRANFIALKDAYLSGEISHKGFITPANQWVTG